MTPTNARAYRFWLSLLPRSFRDEFADDMTLDFGEQRRLASGAGILALWASTLSALLALAVRLRWDQLRLDLRDATRSLFRHKTFALTAIATLALAFGPATTVFTLIDRVLLDPIPRVSMDRLFYIWSANPGLNRHSFPWSELNFADVRARQGSFAAMAAFTATSSTIGGTDSPQQVIGAMVTEDMFAVLGVSPAQGRRFEPGDFVPGAEPVIVLGDDLAAARFGQQSPIGESLTVDGRVTRVVGVLPRGLSFPRPEYWVPITIDPARSARGQNYLNMIGRLSESRTEAQALQELNQITGDLEREHPGQNTGLSVELATAARQLTRSTRRIVTVLGLAAAAILLLACTNIASLLVVRTASRQTELAVRTALGASRSRLTRQLLTENLLVALVAALAGVGVAAGLLRILGLARLVPATQLARATIGWESVWFLTSLVSLTAVILGWVVARRATGSASIAPGQRAHSATRELVRLRQALVGLEVGAAVVLLIAAGLLLQSAARLMAIDPGFRTDRLIGFQVSLPMSRYMELPARARFITEVVEKLKQLPGVESASSAAFMPMTDMRATRRFAIEGRPLPAPGAEPLAIDLPAGPDYARTMGLRVIDGRWIDERDTSTSTPVVVISESFARLHFPNERAIGHRLRYYASRPNQPEPPRPEIVGVVNDVRQFGMAEAAADQMYVPQVQRPWGFTSFVIRTAGDPRQVMAALPGAVRAVDPERPIEELRMLRDLVSDSTADRRGLSALLFVAAGVALLISTIGVYGVTAATTAARKRELAIRAAVGANRRGLMGLVIRQGMVAATLGVLAGIVGGLAASGLLEAVLFEVKARDPLTFAAVAIALLLTCGLATYVPARRAVSASPSEALRAE